MAEEPRLKKCRICGEDIPGTEDPNCKKKYCTKCLRERKNARQRAKRKGYVGYKLPTKSEPTSQQTKSLAQVAKEAHDLKLTYGQYLGLINGGGLARYCAEHGFKIPGEGE